MDTAGKVKALEQLRDNLRADYEKVYNPDKVEIGDFTYGFPVVRSWGEDAKLRIGKFCSIGSNVKIYLGGNHRTDWITTYPFNVLLKEQYPGIDNERAATNGDVIIGNDVWIADNVTIMSGVTIGDGAVIANGGVVTKNVPKYEIFGGVPAKFIKYREIALNVKPPEWWEWSIEKIAEVVSTLCSGNLQALMYAADYRGTCAAEQRSAGGRG